MSKIRVTEKDIGEAILKVATKQSDRLANFHTLKEEIPKIIALSTEDKCNSPTRQNEQLWEQQIRNILSHRNSPGNIIYEGFAIYRSGKGFEITESGISYLNKTKLNKSNQC